LPAGHYRLVRGPRSRAADWPPRARGRRGHRAIPGRHRPSGPNRLTTDLLTNGP